MAVTTEGLGGVKQMYDFLNEAKTPIDFPILSDSGASTTKEFGVYDSKNGVALPAIVIVGKSGKVAWTYVADDITDRPEEVLILEQLKKLGGGKAQ